MASTANCEAAPNGRPLHYLRYSGRQLGWVRVCTGANPPNGFRRRMFLTTGLTLPCAACNCKRLEREEALRRLRESRRELGYDAT